jgi:FMN-dependent NADH-azoreductase
MTPSANTTRFGISSGTVSDHVGLIASELAKVPANQTEYIFILNLGINDIGLGQNVETTWKANYLTILDAIHAAFPTAKAYVAKPWSRGNAGWYSSLDTMAGWIDSITAARSTFTYAGPDERTWVKGADDGATMTSDGVHYSTAGNTEAAAQWKAIIQP